MAGRNPSATEASATSERAAGKVFAWLRAINSAVAEGRQVKGKRMTGLDLQLAVAATRWIGSDLTFFRSQAEWGADCGVTEKGAHVVVDRLVGAGFLVRVNGRRDSRSKGRPAQTYRVNFPVGDGGKSTFTPSTNGENEPNFPVRHGGTFPVHGRGHSIEESMEIYGRDTPLPPKIAKPAAASRKPVASAEDLRRFLEVYPASRHRAPDAAVSKALATAMRTAPIEEILSGAGRYAAERASEDPQYTKAATNWLRGRGWEMTAPPPAPRRQDDMRAAMAAVAQVALQSAVRFDDEEVGNDW